MSFTIRMDKAQFISALIMHGFKLHENNPAITHLYYRKADIDVIITKPPLFSVSFTADNIKKHFDSYEQAYNYTIEKLNDLHSSNIRFRV